MLRKLELENIAEGELGEIMQKGAGDTVPEEKAFWKLLSPHAAATYVERFVDPAIKSVQNTLLSSGFSVKDALAQVADLRKAQAEMVKNNKNVKCRYDYDSSAYGVLRPFSKMPYVTSVPARKQRWPYYFSLMRLLDGGTVMKYDWSIVDKETFWSLYMDNRGCREINRQQEHTGKPILTHKLVDQLQASKFKVSSRERVIEKKGVLFGVNYSFSINGPIVQKIYSSKEDEKSLEAIRLYAEKYPDPRARTEEFKGMIDACFEKVDAPDQILAYYINIIYPENCEDLFAGFCEQIERSIKGLLTEFCDDRLREVVSQILYFFAIVCPYISGNKAIGEVFARGVLSHFESRGICLPADWDMMAVVSDSYEDFHQQLCAAGQPVCATGEQYTKSSSNPVASACGLFSAATFLPFKIGGAVIVQGLTSEKGMRLNGLTGVFKGLDHRDGGASGRYKVEVPCEVENKILLLKPENFRPSHETSHETKTRLDQSGVAFGT